MNVRIGKSTSFLFNLWIPAFGPTLSNGCCRCAAWRGRVRESCDRMDISWPTEQLTFVSRRILINQLRPWRQAIRAWLLIFGRAWLKEDRKIYPHESFGSIKAVGGCKYLCLCVCVWLVEHHVTRLKHQRMLSLLSPTQPTRLTLPHIHLLMKGDN